MRWPINPIVCEYCNQNCMQDANPLPLHQLCGHAFGLDIEASSPGELVVHLSKCVQRTFRMAYVRLTLTQRIMGLVREPLRLF